MKRKDLVKLMMKAGFQLSSHGGNHDIYQSPITGKLFSVGRHAKEEVREGTLKGILKDAGLKIK